MRHFMTGLFGAVVGCGYLAGSLVYAGQVDETNFTSFTADSVARAQEVNDNFTALKNAINENDQRITENANANTSLLSKANDNSTVLKGKQDNINFSCSGANAFIRSITQQVQGDGSTTTVITCDTDQLSNGTGIQSVNAAAGSGLTVSGTTQVTVGTDDTVLQKRIQDCPPNQALNSVDAAGVPSCIPTNTTLTSAVASDPASNIVSVNQSLYIPVQSRTFTAPATGKVLISFTGYYGVTHTTGTQSKMEMALGSGTQCNAAGAQFVSTTLPSYRLVQIDAALPTAVYREAIATSAVLDVTAFSQYTICLAALSLQTDGGLPAQYEIGYPSLSAIFIPNSL